MLDSKQKLQWAEQCMTDCRDPCLKPKSPSWAWYVDEWTPEGEIHTFCVAYIANGLFVTLQVYDLARHWFWTQFYYSNTKNILWCVIIPGGRFAASGRPWKGRSAEVPSAWSWKLHACSRGCISGSESMSTGHRRCSVLECHSSTIAALPATLGDPLIFGVYVFCRVTHT